MAKRVTARQTLPTGAGPKRVAPIAPVSNGSQTSERIGNSQTFLGISILTSGKFTKNSKTPKILASKRTRKTKNKISNKWLTSCKII